MKRKAEDPEQADVKQLQKSIILQGESPRKDNTRYIAIIAMEWLYLKQNISIESQIEEAESNLKTVITAYNEVLPEFHQSIVSLTTDRF